MKKLLLIPFFSLLMLACGPGKKEAVAVNDRVVGEVAKCSETEKVFFQVCATYNPTAIGASLEDFNAACQAAKKNLEAQEVHQKLEGLKEAGLQLVSTYVAMEADYKEYARLYSIQDKDYTIEDEKQTEKVIRKINEKINAAYEAFKAVQREFAKKYGYSLDK